MAQRASIPDLEVRQNGQLPRLCDVRLPNVDVVYVAPFALNEDVSQYFSKVRDALLIPSLGDTWHDLL